MTGFLPKILDRIRLRSLLPPWLFKLPLLSGRFRSTRQTSGPVPDLEQLTLSPCVTVVIPTLNEAKRIAQVVSYALADPLTAEVIVVDDSSIDGTVALATQAGARVVTSSMLGKGGSMHDGVGEARCDVLIYLDGDLSGLRTGIITDMCRPLLMHQADFVKARFGRGGGRVTVLTAKPMLQIFFPEVAHFAQPLGGIIAARKSLLQTLRFEDGYGVDVALLIDAALAGATLVEVDIGSLENDSQPLLDLGAMANEVGRIIFNRAKEVGRLHIEQIGAMYESQRQAAASIEYVLTRRKGRQRLLLLDMDGTITPSHFIVELARATGIEANLRTLLDHPVSAAAAHASGDAITRIQGVAKLFRFVHKQKFEQVARTLEIRPGVIEFVNQMRRRGFMVGVVSDSYFIAADVMRRRIFADFALAHTMQFDADVCNGMVCLNPAFAPVGARGESGDFTDVTNTTQCKSHVLRHFLADPTLPAITESWVVGGNLNDVALMRLADRAFVVAQTSPGFCGEPCITEIASFADLLALLPESEPTPPKDQVDLSAAAQVGRGPVTPDFHENSATFQPKP